MTTALSEPLPDGSARCLVVDPDPDVRQALVGLLQAQGLCCLAAATGRGALELVGHNGSFPIMIADIRMPDLDGFELLAEMRRRSPDTAVVLLSRTADSATAVECLHHGAADFLLKPVSIRELRARVVRALEKRALSLQNRYYQEYLEQRIHAQSRRIQEIFLQGVQMLARALEAKDAYTRGHSIRVSQYAVATARQLGFSGDDLQQIRLGGELHDIGKIGTREALLHKPGSLTPEEMGQIREHPSLGVQMLAPLAHESPAVLRCVRSHHERMDGSGFPDRLGGDDIPIEARIIAVADSFDAMTSQRPYRKPYSVGDALAELRHVSGSQLDAQVVLAFDAVYTEVAPLVPVGS
jgi:putative nucleotidyltransferase with HDIG domain